MDSWNLLFKIDSFKRKNKVTIFAAKEDKLSEHESVIPAFVCQKQFVL